MEPLQLQPIGNINNLQMLEGQRPPQISEKDKEIQLKLRGFFDTFYSIMINETREKQLFKYYEDGIRLILEVDTIDYLNQTEHANEKVQLKDKILNVLLYLFPEKPELYYFTACIYKEVDMTRYLMWLHLCMDKDPTFTENILDIIKVYFDMNKTASIDHLNKKYGNVIYGSTNKRIQLSSSAVLLKSHRKNSAKLLLEELIFHKEFQPEQQILLYITVIRLYLEMSTTDMVIYYINKSIEYCNVTPDIKPDLLRKLYDNIMIAFDYMYHTMENRQQICNLFRNIHSSLPHSNRLVDPSHPIPEKVCITETELGNQMTVNTPIKIGYVSSDMVSHAVSHFIIPILENHSEKFEIYCFTKNEMIQLPTIKKCIPIGGLDANTVAHKIREMGIDILIDLNGYTSDNRLDVFEYIPAPIQVTYLGYPNSLLLDYIHYRITDIIADHETSCQIYTEKLVKLPDCFLLFKDTFPRNLFRLKKDLSQPVILGSLNKESKINTLVLDVWREIMEENPNTKILIKLDSVEGEDVGRMDFFKKMLNVDASRILLVNYMKEDMHYMELFKEIDILLDTFPYSGTTTTCKALYSSVPVITLYNKDYHSHCVSASILINSQLQELVAYSAKEYKEKVSDLCNNREKLEYYRSGFISENFDACMNPEKFMQNYEKGLMQIYLHAYQTRKNDIL
jgi:predicted O-linked N-acetylglucosamine transferase (SPINDLY family)